MYLYDTSRNKVDTTAPADRDFTILYRLYRRADARRGVAESTDVHTEEAIRDLRLRKEDRCQSSVSSSGFLCATRAMESSYRR